MKEFDEESMTDESEITHQDDIISSEDFIEQDVLEDLNINVYTRENTKELILHNEYEEALMASDMAWAEDHYDNSMELSTTAGAGMPGVGKPLLDVLSSDNEDEMPDKMREYMHWSREPYYEEYNPDKE